MGETVEQCYARIKAHGLTLKQQSAVDLLVAGNNDTKTAELLSVARTTVSKWRCYDPAFQAALQARRADVWGSSLDQLRSLIPKAIARIAQELDHKLYSHEAAMALLRLIKIPSLVPTGPSSAEQVIEDLTTERMMARRHACMEDLGEMTGMKEKFPAPEIERQGTREDVLAVLSHRLNDVGPSKSDPWETRQEYAKARFSQAPGGGSASEQSATPVPPGAPQPAAEPITPAAATPEVVSAAPADPIMPVETQRRSDKRPDPASATAILPGVLHNPMAPCRIATEPAAANAEVPPEPPLATPAAGNGLERSTTPAPAAPASPKPERNGTDRSATPVPSQAANLAVGSLPVTPEPEVASAASMATVPLVPNAPAGSVPARNAGQQPATPPDTDPPTAARNGLEHSTTPATAPTSSATATGTPGSVAAAPQPSPQEVTAWTVVHVKAIRAELEARDARDKT